MKGSDLFKRSELAANVLAVSESEAARLLGVSARTLFTWRSTGKGPRHVKTGARVLYAVSELRRWLENAAADTSDMPAASPPVTTKGALH